jgi:hypothetical protein
VVIGSESWQRKLQNRIASGHRTWQLDTGYVLADKAYDSDEIIFSLSARSIIPIIPPKTNRKSQRFYDKNIYKKRHVIENFVPQNEWNDTPFPLNTSRIFTPLSRHSMFAPSLSLLPDFDDSLWIMTSLKPPLFA